MKTWCVLLIVMTSCERSDESSGVDCPLDATVMVFQTGSGDEALTRKECDWPGGRVVIATDTRGKVVERIRTIERELDGLQIMREPGRNLRLEVGYRRDQPHGWSREFKGDELVHECFYIDGVRDGFCWSTWLAGMPVTDVQQFDRGRRTGLWSMGPAGKVTRTWVYGDDILLAIDGRSVPLPPASIEVDGEVVWRTRCSVKKVTDPCRALFDDHQICELEPADRTSCRERALSRYRSATPRR